MAKPSWVTLDKSSGTGGGSVNVTAASNSSTSTRSGTLTIKTASGLTKSVSISQEKAVVYTAQISAGTLKIIPDTPGTVSGTSISVRLCFASSPSGNQYEDYVEICEFAPYFTSSGTSQPFTQASKTFDKPYYCMGIQIGGISVSGIQRVYCQNINVRRNGTLFVTNSSTGQQPFVDNFLADKTINFRFPTPQLMNEGMNTYSIYSGSSGSTLTIYCL